MGTITNLNTTNTYSTLDSAIDSASTDDVLEISGTDWAADDDTNVTATVAVTIRAASGAECGALVASGIDHYRLIVKSGNAIETTVSLDITGVEIANSGTGSSDECIRLNENSISLSVKRCLIYFDSRTDQQDAIYVNAKTGVTVTAENCINWNTYRGFVDAYNSSGTFNINSCHFYNLGFSIASDSRSGLVGKTGTGATTVNCFNSLIHLFDASYYVFTASAGENTLTVDRCITNSTAIAWDNSLTETITDSITSATWATTGATGDYVVVENLTAGSEDLRLVDNADNDAQDAHADASGAGLTMPSTDIVGTSRPVNTNYDIGPFEYGVAISAATTGTATASIDEDDITAGGKTIILTLTGDTFVTGTTSEDGIAAGSDSDKTGANKWDALIKTDLDNGDVVLSGGDTVATITLPTYATYDTTETETITWTIPAASLTTSSAPIVATPTFTIAAVAVTAVPPALHNLDNQFATITASKLNGVLQ